MTLYTAKLETKLGRILLASSEEAVVLIGLSTEEKFYSELKRKYPDARIIEDTVRNRRALDELEEYFAGERRSFSVPFAFHGTDFQKRVWNALTEIPYGTTVTYKHIAIKIGKPQAVRAVGNANNRNPISIIVPCHRVIGSDGKLIGYGGGLGMKEKLLQLEGVLLT